MRCHCLLVLALGYCVTSCPDCCLVVLFFHCLQRVVPFSLHAATVLSSMCAGGLAGAAANTICYPFDFARTRLASDLGKGGGKFKGIWDCIATTVRNQGITGLYTGQP